MKKCQYQNSRGKAQQKSLQVQPADKNGVRANQIDLESRPLAENIRFEIRKKSGKSSV
jgi:hypothetical protein